MVSTISAASSLPSWKFNNRTKFQTNMRDKTDPTRSLVAQNTVPAQKLTDFCSGHVYTMDSAPAGLCNFNSRAMSFSTMSILSKIFHQKLKSRPWPSPDAIFVATSQTRDRAMQPSAACVRSRVISKCSDWIKGDKIIVVLLYTCGRQTLQRHDSRFSSTLHRFYERSF